MILIRTHQRLRFSLAAASAALLLAVLFVQGGLPLAAQTATAKAPALVVELTIDDIIHPIMVEYVGGAIDQAARSNASLILITMNTPGGLDSSMRDIIHRILYSPVPVVVYVHPSGSHAASAGFFILLSADVAAMAPGTNTGAASPVFVVGGQTVNIDETMRKKVTEDAAAYLRSFAEKRGRNVQLAEKAVTDAKAWTDKEALDGKLIDLIAATPEALLAQLNGRTITRFDGKSVKLELGGATRTRVEMSQRQSFLSRIVRPDVFFVLMILGVLGLYTEFTHPGMIVPGVIGGISIVLALFAMHMLPVNATGVILILLGIALFILEAKYASHGVLGVGGAVAMVLGAMMLIRSPMTGMRVSLWVALGATIPFALIVIFLMRLVLQSMSWKPAMGANAMVGAIGEVTETIDGRGMVFVAGELWRAASPVKVPEGARVRVTKVEGLTVHVEPIEPAQAPEQKTA
jgi:membrane-bound serine protease (ClpP class)